MGGIIKGNSGDIIDISVRDYSGAKLGTWRANIGDEDEVARILQNIFMKYNPSIIESLLKKNKLTKVDWLGTEGEFLKF